MTLTTCSKCGHRYDERLFTKADLSQADDWARAALNKLVTMAPDDPPESPVTKKKGFEAALGTLSMVADEVPELQAAKIRHAINVIVACAKTE